MVSLLFEIWEDEDGNGCLLQQVARRSDEFRRKIHPNSVLIHSFRAATDFEAFRINSQLLGYGPWKEPDSLEEQWFTEAEKREQDAYLRERAI